MRSGALTRGKSSWPWENAPGTTMYAFCPWTVHLASLSTETGSFCMQQQQWGGRQQFNSSARMRGCTCELCAQCAASPLHRVAQGTLAFEQ